MKSPRDSLPQRYRSEGELGYISERSLLGVGIQERRGKEGHGVEHVRACKDDM